jgi:glycosyltransferase involved in cell wall biosynthesis
MRDLGHEVEVWSTSTDSLEPRNDNLAKETVVDGIPVRRFPTNLGAQRLFKWAHRKVQRWPRSSVISRLWVHASPYGLGMREALEAERDKHDVIYLFHYHSGAAHRLVDVAPLKTIVHPWIHNEAILRSRAVAKLLATPTLVTLNSAEEAVVAIRARVGFSTVRTAVIGNPVHELAAEGDISPAVRDAASQPFILFIGRLIAEKNLAKLVDWHVAANDREDTKIELLAVGKGPLLEKLGPRKGVIQLAAVSEGEKAYLLRRCLALVNPSKLESFSLVVMEAWRAGRPVIVHEACDTTAGHVLRCSGGFAVGDAEGYARALDALLADPIGAARMGGAGMRYVAENFSEAAIARNLSSILDRFP